MHDTTLIPVNVLTGFLGSGKTTLLNRWVRQASMRNTLVVINEFGEIGLDHQLLTHSDEQAVVEMSSGCLCCTLRGDLSRTLQQALDAQAAKGKPAPERVVIETTGLADPAPLLQLMMTDHWLAHRFQLDSVICCIDAANGDTTLRTHRESQRQVAVADRLLITKTDLVDEHLLSALANQLATLNPAAEQWQVLSGNLNPELLVGAGLYQAGTGRYRVESWLKSASYHTTLLASGQPEDSGKQQSLAPLAPPAASAHHDDQIKAFCFSVEERISPEALESWLDLLMAMMGDRMLRMKAIVHLQDRDTPLALHGVQHIFHPPASLPAHSVSDQVSRFVFITHNVSPDTVRQLYTFFNAKADSVAVLS